jgi:hypothetical protein
MAPQAFAQYGTSFGSGSARAGTSYGTSYGSGTGTQSSGPSGALIRSASSFRDSSPAYSARNKIVEGWKREREAKSAKKSGEAPPADAEGSSFRIPQGSPLTPRVRSTAGPEAKVFPEFRAAPPAAAQEAAEAGAAAPAAPPPGALPARVPATAPPPRTVTPVGLRAIKLIPVEEGAPSRFDVLAARERLLAQRALDELANRTQPIEEIEMVRHVLRALGAPVPATREQLVSLGFPVAEENLETGDLVFFQLGKGARRSRHVGIYAGEGTFSYATRSGVKTGELQDPRWSESFEGARRIR